MGRSSDNETTWRLADLMAEIAGEARIAGRDVRSFVRRTAAGPPDLNVCFIRIPKCATSAVDGALIRAFRSPWVFEGNGIQPIREKGCDAVARGLEGDGAASTWDVRRRILTYYLSHPKTRYVAGHVPVDRALVEGAGTDFVFVTTLRHPVDRWISHYYYNKFTASREQYDIDQGIDDFVETERGRGLAQLYAAYFGGAVEGTFEERESEEVQERARQTLDAFDVIGIVDNLSALETTFDEKYDLHIDVGSRNANPSSRNRDDLPDSTIQKIRRACAADLRLYEWVRD